MDRGSWHCIGGRDQDHAQEKEMQKAKWLSEEALQIAVNRRESESEVAQSCPTLWDPMDCSPPGFSIHGILQARILEWVAISFSRESSQPRDGTQVSCITGRCFNLWATREAGIDKIYSKSWKEKNLPPRILYPARLSFKIGEKIISQTSKN